MPKKVFQIAPSLDYYPNPAYELEGARFASDERHKEAKNKEDVPERGQWGNKAQFLLSCIGLSVGLGNIWRFPYLAYQNGGGAFLLPYIILMIVVGKPLYYMEVAIGQFASLGPMSVWRCVPAAKGVGIAMLIVSIVVSVYYNVILAYTFFYLAQSFRSQLPWQGCYEWWGATSDACYIRSENVTRCKDVNSTLQKDFYNSTSFLYNAVALIKDKNTTIYVPGDVYEDRSLNCTSATKTASELFWERYVLDLSSGIDDIGGIKWELALCLMASWIVVFLCLMKGVKSSGKVVYFTATFPYVILFVLLVRGVTLDGAVDGIKYFFIPEWKKLADLNIWRKAAEQLFYSLAVSWGGIIMFGSYNKFNNNFHVDALVISTMDFLTSLIGGVVIFSVLGYMAKELNVDISQVAQAGQGLAFVAYPEALSRIVVPQLWSVLFFFMLFLLGLDSEFALLETFLTAIYDELPKSRNYKIPLTLGLCFVCFLLGLPCVTRGGQYIFDIMDTYAGGISIIFIAVFEVIAIMWVYGYRRFCYDIKLMLGHYPGWYWKASWIFFSPVILAFLFIYGLVEYSKQKKTYGDYQYPSWAEGLGWSLALLSMVQIPLWAAIVVFQNRKNWRKAFKPLPEWGPADEDEFKSYRAKFPVEDESCDQPGVRMNKF